MSLFLKLDNSKNTLYICKIRKEDIKMALGSSSFGTILQASVENHQVNNVNGENVAEVATNYNSVETAGSIAWGGFDVCEFSTTTEVDYTAYTSAPVETAGSIASAPIGSFANAGASVTGTISVASAGGSSAPAVSCSCSYSC